jgi:hypothetical protein
MHVPPRLDQKPMTVMKRIPLLLILFLLILPRASEAQDIPYFYPPRASEGPDIPRFNLRFAVGVGLPTGDFSLDNPMTGGYADAGITYQYGVAVRITRGLMLLGEIMVIHFPIEQVTLSVAAGRPMDGARWDIDGAGVSLRTDFGERGTTRVFFQGGVGTYQGSTGVVEGPLGTTSQVKSRLALNAGMGMLFLYHHLTAELGVRMHLPTFEFAARVDRKATWMSLDIGLMYGVGR